VTFSILDVPINGGNFNVTIMHELAVTQGILDIALKNAGSRKIKQINLVIGQFSSMVDDSVQFYWDLISKNTAAQGATLNFERIPGEMTCRACGEVFQPKAEAFECPACLSPLVKISKGEEFRVDSIDVE
jgi:hydrogenase nickel incorporation protein HypA/HybF